MAVVDVVGQFQDGPIDSVAEGLDETRLGILDIQEDDLPLYAMTAPEDRPYSNLYQVVHEKLGGQIIRRFQPHGRKILLTAHLDARDPEVEVRTVMSVETETPFQSGSAFCLAMKDGITYIRQHEFSRHGSQERTTNHRPLDEVGKAKLSQLLGVVHGNVVAVE